MMTARSWRAILLAAALPFVVTPARAQDASPDLLDADFQAAVAQRDQALNEGVRLSAHLVVAQREIARLRKELDEAKKPAPPASEPAK